jgi:hypothetical protein
MSLRDNNKNLPAIISGQEKLKSGSLRAVHRTSVAQPTGIGIEALKKAVKTVGPITSGNIGFLFDATASRSDVWCEAQDIISNMFRSIGSGTGISMRMVEYGSQGDIVDHAWQNNVDSMCESIKNVECRGGITQINECLNKFVSDHAGRLPSAIIFVGDHYEEDESELEASINLMKDNNIKVFTFLDSEDSGAESVFRRLAEQTGGKFAKFGKEMPLKDLCEAVALLATGGSAALARLNNKAVQQLFLPKVG